MSAYYPPDLRLLDRGDQLGRYELICPLAEGGTAAVWLANQRGCHGFNKRVALKTILPTHSAETSFRTFFMEEARIASRIDHENVAQVLDLGEDFGVLYLVVEWVDGESLRMLESAAAKNCVRVPENILLRVLADTCAGLHAVHELCDDRGNSLNVVHRDISPQNILVSAHGATKIIDFGIAKTRNRLSSETAPGTVRGKLQYMAPEQALGLPVDRRADIWAVGAVFYRLVTGHSPFDAGDPAATRELLRRGRIAEPLYTRSNVHPAVREVIDTALSPSPWGRFASAAEMREALESAMEIAGMDADSNDVAAFAGTHLGARRAARHAAIRAALGIVPAQPLDDCRSPKDAEVTTSHRRRVDVEPRVEPITIRPGAYSFVGSAASELRGETPYAESRSVT